MKFIGAFLGAALLALLLLGCPYESKVAMAPPKAGPVDTLLTGYWVVDSTDKGEEQAIVEILPFNDAEYVFMWTPEDGAAEHYRGYPIQIGNQVIWNFNELKQTDAKKSYYFGRSTMGSDGRLTFALMNDDGVPKGLDTDAQELRKFMEAHMNDSSFYDHESSTTLRRPKADEVEDGRLRTWDK